MRIQTSPPQVRSNPSPTSCGVHPSSLPEVASSVEPGEVVAFWGDSTRRKRVEMTRGTGQGAGGSICSFRFPIVPAQREKRVQDPAWKDGGRMGYKKIIKIK
ncbi:hypothetical protein CDAR_1371 [Caerostris darwini]|uniref:Uncharacterized protein n=1 Tax=Caerostris darwini TaxID=1538125 RepID=A0AAV4THC0_9ARAC|nr:hypothetical protein CDAR_1371 [Caerostris darwini]